MKPSSRPLGIHILLDLGGAPFATLDDPILIQEALLATIREMGATVLGVDIHRLAPQGVSGVVVIAESHLTIHTWPELGEAAVDLFTCAPPEKARAAVRGLTERLGGTRSIVRELSRGVNA